MAHIEWHGTPEQYDGLYAAVNAHCVCTFNLMGVRTTKCEAHKMLEDQRTLNHLAFAATLRLQCEAEEYSWQEPASPEGT